MTYKIRKHIKVLEDEKYLKEMGYLDYYERLLDALEKDPNVLPPKYHALIYNLRPCLSRDIPDTVPRTEHRLVYKINEVRKEVTIFSACFHYPSGTIARIRSEPWTVVR